MGLTKKIKTTDREPEEKIPSPELTAITNTLHELKNRYFFTENPSEFRRLIKQTYKDMCSLLINEGAEFITDVNTIYKKFGENIHSPLIVRREDPEKVLALSEGFDVNLSFDPKVVYDGDDGYANCALWPYGPDAMGGIRNAFLEGRNMAGPIATLIALKQNPENAEIKKPKDALMIVGDIKREAVRIVSGTLTKEDLQFILLRFQKDFFPTESLTEQEKAVDVKQIFRGFTF